MRPHMNIPRIALVLLASLICFGCSDASEDPTPDPTADWEKVTEKYENGGVKFSGYQLEDGTRVGHWTQWYENGKKWYEGDYKDGEGHWTFWYENGKKWYEGEFKNHQRNGIWMYWNEDGSIDHELSGIYKDHNKVAHLPKKKD